MAKTKLAFLAPEFLPTWGGVGIYSVELVKQLCLDEEWEVHVITPTRGTDYDKSRILRFFDDRITLHNLSHASDGFFYNLKFQLALLRKFNSLQKKHHFDLVHAANVVHMPDIYLKFARLDIPSLTTVHTTLQGQTTPQGSAPKEMQGQKRSAVERMTSLCYPAIRLLQGEYIKRTHNFIAVSHWISGQLPLGKRTEVIHNGIDMTKFQTRASSRFGYFRDMDKPIVLYTGRLMALKGLPTLFRSMEQILKKADAHFVFAGSGDIAQWRGMLSKIPPDKYTFLEYVPYEYIHELYAACDIFVLPSYTESFPLSILEAMASKKAVIASNVGGIPEMMESKKHGMLVEPGDEKQLTEALLALIGNSLLRKKLSEQAFSHVRKNFDSRVMAKKTKRFYENVLS